MATTNKTPKTCKLLLNDVKIIYNKIQKTIRVEPEEKIKNRLKSAQLYLKQAAVQINIASTQSK